MYRHYDEFNTLDEAIAEHCSKFPCEGCAIHKAAIKHGCWDCCEFTADYPGETEAVILQLDGWEKVEDAEQKDA